MKSSQIKCEFQFDVLEELINLHPTDEYCPSFKIDCGMSGKKII